MDVIELNKLDQRFKYEIASRPGGEHFKRCFSCGTCTAACPVALVSPEYNPMKLIRMALLGMRDEVLSSPSLWLCTLCYICYATCPQDVRFRDVMEVLRDMAVEGGYVGGELRERIDRVNQLSHEIRCKMVQFLFDKDERLMSEIKSMMERLKEI
jgi:heterodisulfide reductase subunit C